MRFRLRPAGVEKPATSSLTLRAGEPKSEVFQQNFSNLRVFPVFSEKTLTVAGTGGDATSFPVPILPGIACQAILNVETSVDRASDASDRYLQADVVSVAICAFSTVMLSM